MSDEPTPPRPNGRPNGLVGRGLDLVAGVNTWKRAFILLLFGFAGLTGVMLYQHPNWVEEVAATYRHEETFHLVDTEQIKHDIPILRTAIQADLVVVFRTEVSKNEQWMIAYDTTREIGEVIENTVKDRWHYTRPFLSEASPWNPIVIELLNGNSGCYPITESHIALPLLKQLTVVCVMGIPPGPESLLGWIVAGFVQALDRPQMSQVRAVMRKQAVQWMVQ